MTTSEDTPKPARKPAKPADKPGAPVRASAAASSDPAVHHLLAEIDIARRNGDDGEVQRLTERLHDLGYE